MTAKSYNRGHAVEYVNGEWIYSDNQQKQDDSRPCARCKKPPTKESHDTCLGNIEGAISACCGHGVEDKYVIMGE